MKTGLSKNHKAVKHPRLVHVIPFLEVPATIAPIQVITYTHRDMAIRRPQVQVCPTHPCTTKPCMGFEPSPGQSAYRKGVSRQGSGTAQHAPGEASPGANVHCMNTCLMTPHKNVRTVREIVLAGPLPSDCAAKTAHSTNVRKHNVCLCHHRTTTSQARSTVWLRLLVKRARTPPINAFSKRRTLML